MSKMREEFEEWASSRGMRLATDGVVTTYAYLSTDQAWQVWQASRAVLVIDLPKDPNEEFADRAAAIAACREAIEAAGLRVIL